MLEALRWKNGVFCPHCKHKEVTKFKESNRSRKGLYKCNTCKKQFTVTVGTVFENTRLPLTTWFSAFYFICSSKKGISSLQLSRYLGISYKSAWFMAHRIRYAMKQKPFEPLLSGDVEVDETYVGGKPRALNGGGYKTDVKPGMGTNKIPVVAMVERDGNVRTAVIPRSNSLHLKKVMTKNITRASTIITDDARFYQKMVPRNFNKHESVCHSRKEYARGNINTNTVESYFALVKRSIYGTFHHVSRKHLPRYLDEISFKWNYRKFSDYDRTLAALGMVGGKRLLYK